MPATAMRNPLRRRQENPLGPQAVERLRGIPIYWGDNDESPGVLVNVDAVEAEIDARTDELSEEYSARAIAGFGEGDLDDPEYRARMEAAADADVESPEFTARMQAITEVAFNNTDHWIREIEPKDDQTRCMLLKLDVATGRIGGQHRG